MADEADMPRYLAAMKKLAGTSEPGTCGAKTGAGTPCKLTSIYKNGRCKFHGGLSTGPTSAAGKQKAALNGFRPKKKRSP